MSVHMNGYKDVVLVDILNNYRNNFHNRSCVITTNYKGLKEFKVSFHDDGLPHLLGLHYVSKTKFGSSITANIDNGKMTAETILKHHEFAPRDIKNRILLYPFLNEVFFDQKIKVCVPMTGLKPNSMKLDCVFTKISSKNEIVLGLKRDCRNSIFKPATLHLNKKPKYNHLKCSKVESIIWI